MLIIYVPRVRFSNENERWKAESESFPTVFEFLKTLTTAQSYDPLKFGKIQRKKNVDIGEKSPQFCMDGVTK